MNATVTILFFLATSAMDSAGAYALDLHQKRQAETLRVAKINAAVDAALAKSAAGRQETREILDSLQQEREYDEALKRMKSSPRSKPKPQ